MIYLDVGAYNAPYLVVTVHTVHQRIYGKAISYSKVGCVVRTATLIRIYKLVMTHKVAIGFVLSLILLISSCGGDSLRQRVPDFIKLGNELEFEHEFFYCAAAVFELKNKDIDALRRQMEDIEYWKNFPSLNKYTDGMSASLKVIFCGTILKKYSKISSEMTNDPSKYPNGYYYVSGDDIFIAVLTDKKLVFIFEGY